MHGLFVDDDLIAEVYDRQKILRAIAAFIKTIFILLGESDLSKRQDPISWEKMLEMLINYVNVALGLQINTRQMTIGPTQQYLTELNNLLSHWHGQRKSFTINELETLVGKLGHLTQVSCWMKHLMGHLFVSLAAALGDSRAHLITTSASFRDLLKSIKNKPATDEDAMISSFAQAETARAAKEEIRIIRTALLDNSIHKHSPIAHMIPRGHDAVAPGDSCLHAMGGFSIEMKYWFYHEWPEELQLRTLKHIKNDKDGELVVINCMEYATFLVGYAAAYYYWVTCGNAEKLGIEYPCVLFLIDNTSAETCTRKGCKNSTTGRALVHQY
jgi:hypothetical protein